METTMLVNANNAHTTLMSVKVNSLSIPYYITNSTAKLINFHQFAKFSLKSLALSFFLLTFALAIQTIVFLSGRATVIAYGFFAAGFFYALSHPFGYRGVSLGSHTYMAAA